MSHVWYLIYQAYHVDGAPAQTGSHVCSYIYICMRTRRSLCMAVYVQGSPSGYVCIYSLSHPSSRPPLLHFPF